MSGYAVGDPAEVRVWVVRDSSGLTVTVQCADGLPVTLPAARWLAVAAFADEQIRADAWRRAPWWRKLLMALARDSRAYR